MGGDDGCHFGRKRTSWIRADTFTCAGDSGPWATSEGTVHAGATGTEVETGAKTREAAAQRRQAPGPEAPRWRLGTGTGSWTRRDSAGGGASWDAPGAGLSGDCAGGGASVASTAQIPTATAIRAGQIPKISALTPNI